MASSVLQPLFVLWLALIGLAVGSFINVLIVRLPAGTSIVTPRSRCPHCGHTLAWWENVPLVSWMALRGKCRACKAPISVRYPLVEASTALLFLAALARFDWTWPLVSALLLITVLVPLTFIDLEHWLLPFSLTLPGIVLGVLSQLPQGLDALRDGAIGAGVGFAAFWALEWIGEKAFRKEALGGGDKYLLALIGAFQTYRCLLGIVLLTSLQASIVGLVLLAVRGRAGPAPKAQANEPSEAAEVDEDDWVPGPTNIPLGPWLALASLEVLFFGERLARWLPYPTGHLLFGA